ncbi:LON peptidase substrate-binding domain-containing protein [Candidatus Pelagibacter sp.]|uniref:LON peptidase substrate-binding domain-containing protein n=1 Tax=Candidatus Pelagibacter sp. TaxID=2024849 RepID=UPI003F84625E
MINLPKKIPIFPLSNFIMFPRTSVPLYIFEPRYIDMINDAMRSDKFIGTIQPKSNTDQRRSPKLYEIGCMGKITSFKEENDGRYSIELKGIIRFEILEEINTSKKYREFRIDFKKFEEDLIERNDQIKFQDLELIFKDFKSLFEKKGFIINWKALEKQSLDETINALAMASPFSTQEKQVLLEAQNLDIRKNKIAEILKTYTHDIYENNTIQ